MKPHLEISYFDTVADVLKILPQQLSPDSVNPHTQAAVRALPAKRPAAQLFMAWEHYYGNPEARRDALLALDRR